MNRIILLPFLFLPLLLSLAAFPLRAQDANSQEAHLVSIGDLVLDRYVAQHTNEDRLAETVRRLLGREYWVKEHGTGSSAISNIMQLGGTIVTYDTRENVDRVRAMLEVLDVPAPKSEMRAQTLEYRPRFLSLSAAHEALIQRVDVYIPEERGILVMEGTEEELAQAMDYLKSVDVPGRQVLLSCLLLEVGRGGSDMVVPEELRVNLEQLLPGNEFTLAGMALLKTSVTSGDMISLQIESTGKRYRFECLPEAFDEETGSLTVSNCSMLEESGAGTRLLFRTSTVLRGGDYTVLAATGATTRLLVVRILPQD